MSDHVETGAGSASPPASSREKSIAIGLGILGTAGLIWTIILVLTGVELHLIGHHDIKGWVLSLFAFLIGLSLIWTSGLYAKQLGTSHFAHLPREIGMAFLVSAVVFGLVELSLRIAESEKLHKEITIREDLVRFLPLINPRKEIQSVKDYRDGLESLDHLKKTLHSHDQFDEWESLVRDRYGMLLSKNRDFSTALTHLQAALAIDKQRAADNPQSASLAHFMYVGYTRIAPLQVHLCKFSEAHASHAEAVERMKAIIEANMLDDDAIGKFRNRLKSFEIERDHLAELVGVESVPEKLVLGDTDGSHPETDMAPLARKLGDAKTGDGTEKRLRMVRDYKLQKGVTYRIEVTADRPTFDPLMVILCPKEGVYLKVDNIPNVEGWVATNPFRVVTPSIDATYRVVALRSLRPHSEAVDKTGSVKLTVKQQL